MVAVPLAKRIINKLKWAHCGNTMFDFDLCIIGTGRVGLPLALAFIETGLQVQGVDVDEALCDKINGGEMPFHEPGFDQLLATRPLKVHASPEIAAQCASIVVTVDTPLHNHIESDLRCLERVVSNLLPHLRPGHLLCLRSTIAPRTTRLVKRWVEKGTKLKVGEDIALSFCPERIAEGKAREELKSLPQIIGAEDDLSRSRSQALFSKLTDQVMHTSYLNAELVKLFTNAERYVHFALANQFALIADTLDANVYEIQRLANHDYPRNRLAAPGLTGGTCLRKDFGMLNEWIPYPDLLLSAWKMNESIPLFLTQNLLRRTQITGKKVAILGYSFKQASDDIRDSLVSKLYRYIHREGPDEIRIADPNLSDPITDAINGELKNLSAAQAIDGADVVFVAMNHPGFEGHLKEAAHQMGDAWIVDIWNVCGTDRIYYQAKALTEPGVT
jgi:UDP-N-acetyl-D-mannosaminuronic acid dehydrogenase